MQNPPTTIYITDIEHSIDDLYESLRGYEHQREVDEVSDNLVTTIDSVERTERGLGFTIEHDYVQAITQRDREGPFHVKATQTVYGRFAKDIGSDGIMLMGSNHGIARGPVTLAIEGDPDASSQVNISTNAIGRIVSMDSVEARYKIWEDIDMFTNMASIKGKIQDSTYSQDFDEHGRPVWVMFESQFLGNTVGVSQKGYVIYGNDIDPSYIEDYYFEVIRSALNF